MKKRRYKSDRSKFTALENHFLNTFFSGLYFSSADFINIAEQIDMPMQMNSREMLIKTLLNKSEETGKLPEVIALLNKLIDERIATYRRLSINYPGAMEPLTKITQKANGTKSLLARESRGNPYE